MTRLADAPCRAAALTTGRRVAAGGLSAVPVARGRGCGVPVGLCWRRVPRCLAAVGSGAASGGPGGGKEGGCGGRPQGGTPVAVARGAPCGLPPPKK